MNEQRSIAGLAPRSPLWTREYTLALAAMHVYFLTFYGLFGALPLYLEDWSDAAIGLNVGAMSFSAVAARPFAGIVIDRTGRRRSMLWGSAITAVSVGALIVTDNPYALLPARLLHGVAIAFFTTGTLALVTDVVPAERRGQGVAFFGVLNNSASVYAPLLGLVVAETVGFGAVFLGLAGAGLAAFAMTLALNEPERAARDDADEPSRLISRTALPPATIFLGLTVAFGSVQAFSALFADDNDLGSAGLFFALFGASQTLARFPVGPLVDRFGRGPVIVPGLLLGAAGMLVLATAHPATYFLSAVMLGFAVAAAHTGLLAQTMDQAGSAERGAAIATFTLSWDAGAVLGATALGFLADASGYSSAFVVAGVFAVAMAAAYPALVRRRPAPVPAHG